MTAQQLIDTLSTLDPEEPVFAQVLTNKDIDNAVYHLNRYQNMAIVLTPEQREEVWENMYASEYITDREDLENIIKETLKLNNEYRDEI